MEIILQLLRINIYTKSKIWVNIGLYEYLVSVAYFMADGNCFTAEAFN